jgi:hypothetical protein
VVTIYNAGKLAVTNTTSAASSSASIYTAGGIYAAGDIAAAGGVASLAASASDMRLKKDFKDFDALAILDKYKMFEFAWNDTGLAWNKHLNNDYTHYGLAAQQAQIVNPGFVTERQGYLTVDYEKFIPILMRGEQQLNDRIDTLERRVKRLEQENKELRKLIA